MKRIYICSTVYHLLIAIVKQLLYNIDADLIICKEDNVDPSTLCKIKSSKIFKKVITYKDIEYKGYYLRWREKIFHGIKKALAFYESTSGLPYEYLKDNDIYIFNDNSFWGQWLCCIKKGYHLIEDGLDHYIVNPSTSIETARYIYLNKLLGTYNGHHGNSVNMLDLEVNDKNGVHLKSNIKLIECPRKKLFGCLSDKQKKIILELFGVPHDIFIKEEISTLLLPQPLAEDCLVSHQKKIDIYSFLVQKYSKGTLYIKPHPREIENYANIFPHSKIIPFPKIPLELLDLLPNFKFTYGITAFSTSLLNLNCIKNKIFMGYEWTINFDNNKSTTEKTLPHLEYTL